MRSTGPGAVHLMLVLTYVGLVLNASTTFTSLLLFDRLGSLPFISMQLPQDIDETVWLKSGRRLLSRYGAGGFTWNVIEAHCKSLPRAQQTPNVLTFYWLL